MSAQSGRRGNPLWYIPLALVSLLVLFPIWMTIVRSLSDPQAYAKALNGGTPMWPVQPDFSVFKTAITEGKLLPASVQSLIMAFLITAAQVVTSILAAYAFAFLRFPFKRLLFALFAATLMLPLEITFVANVQTIRQLGWIDSMQGLVAPFLATAFGTFLLRQAFLGLPGELREATFLDGYGHMGFLWKFAVPLSRPVIASLTLVSFLTAWNQYLWPRSITEHPSSNTLQLALRSLTVDQAERANVVVAGALIAAVPVVILLIVFQRQIVRGLTAGAVKG